MSDLEMLLCPQVCMDEEPPEGQVDDTDNISVQSDESVELTDDEKIKLLLETDSFDVTQTPGTLTKDEEKLKWSLYGKNKDFPTEGTKLHCTACNAHLGSAPINHFDRYIHPLLQVLICKSCFDFYTSGDFEKDEDGSELYCRWCGQGGKVVCCTQCCFVFCQTCIRRNLGVTVLKNIIDSDNWKCFVCHPGLLMPLKLSCTMLYEYVMNLLKEVRRTQDLRKLYEDTSVCCKPKVKVDTPKSASKQKRKLSSDGDSDEDYMAEKKKARRSEILKNALKTLTKPNTNPTVPKAFTIQAMPRLTAAPKVVPIRQPTQPQTNITTPLQTVVHAPIHRWFDTCMRNTSKVTADLNTALFKYKTELRSQKTIAELVKIQNKMQQLLSSSVNNLIQVRKTLRTDFLAELPLLRTSNGNKVVLKINKVRALPATIVATPSKEVVRLIDKSNGTDKQLEDTQNDMNDANQPLTYLQLQPVSILKPVEPSTVVGATRMPTRNYRPMPLSKKLELEAKAHKAQEANMLKIRTVAEINLCSDDEDDAQVVQENPKPNKDNVESTSGQGSNLESYLSNNENLADQSTVETSVGEDTDIKASSAENRKTENAESVKSSVPVATSKPEECTSESQQTNTNENINISKSDDSKPNHIDAEPVVNSDEIIIPDSTEVSFEEEPIDESISKTVLDIRKKVEDNETVDTSTSFDADKNINSELNDASLNKAVQTLAEITDQLINMQNYDLSLSDCPSSLVNLFGSDFEQDQQMNAENSELVTNSQLEQN